MLENNWNDSAYDELSLPESEADDETLNNPALAGGFAVPELRQLHWPLGLIGGGIVLAILVYFGIGAIFPSPLSFQLAGTGVADLNVDDGVFNGDTHIGRVRSVKLRRSGTVAQLEVERRFAEELGKSPQFEVETQATPRRVVVAGTSKYRSQFQVPTSLQSVALPSLGSVLAVIVVLSAVGVAGVMIWRIAQVTLKLVGMALAFAAIAVAVFYFLGQLKILTP